MKRNELHIRTVKLTRSHAGFGFTITGQQPCVLSCIVRGSPAFEIGLRAGDLVVGVNGDDVTSSQHDDVVRKIGSSGATITLQIMERRHRSRGDTSSSASDGENVSPSRYVRRDAARQRRHRRHRHRSAARNSADKNDIPDSTSTLDTADIHGARTRRSEQFHRPPYSRTSRYVHEDPVRSYDDNPYGQFPPYRSSGFGSKKRHRPNSEALDHFRQRATLNNVFPNALVPPSQLRPSGELRPDDTYEQPGTSVSNERLHPSESKDAVTRALVGYCGSVEVPVEGRGSWNKLSTIRGALSRLKNEGRVHVLIILDILPSSVRLINHYGKITAEYSSSRIIYYGAHPDDERYFGLVVTLTGSRPSLSCHVFRTLDPDHCRHSVHGKEALAWGITCHLNSRGECMEFPSSPSLILRCLASLSTNQHVQTSTRAPEEKITHNRNIRPQSVPPHSMQDIPSTKPRSRSPEARPGSVPPQRDPLEDKLSPRAILKIGSQQQVNNESEFKAPRPVPIGGSEKENIASNPQPNFFRRFVKTGGSFRKKMLGISQSQEILPTTDHNRNDNGFISSKPNSLSQQSVNIVESLHPSNTVNLSHNTTLAHSEKSVYKTATREAHLDDDLTRVARWATGIDNLLNDRQGIEIFTDFLKSEFSEENILFWRAVEKYKRVQDDSYRRFRAQEIFSKYLASDAPEQINIDSSTRDSVTSILQDTSVIIPPSLFDDTQLQIYNLMRMDSYGRFLKSDIYKNYVVGELEIRPRLRNNENPDLATPDRAHTLKAAKSSASLGHPDSEEKKRRSLFPWLRRSKRFGKSSANNSGNSTDLKKTSKSPSRSSSKKEADFDTASKTHCRITFPDGSSTVIGSNTLGSQTTVRQCLQSACSKRGLALHATEIISNSGSDKIVDLTSSASSLFGKSLSLEPRVVFRLEIPCRHKTLGVRVKETKSLKDVIKQVCLRYSLRMEDCVCSMENQHKRSVPLDTSIKDVDHNTIILRTKDDVNERGTRSRTPTMSQPVVEWLSAPWVTFDQSGIYDPQSSGNVGKSPSTRDKKPDRRSSAFRKSSTGTPVFKSSYPDNLNDTEDERFLDLLTRMTNQRLDDQRGNLPNAPLELPEFFKSKESQPYQSRPTHPTPKSSRPIPPSKWQPQRSLSLASPSSPVFTTPDVPYMDASTIVTSTPRSKTNFRQRDSSPVFLHEVRQGDTPLTDLTTPPPLPFRDHENSGGIRSSRSTPSPSTHLLLPPDSPQYMPGRQQQFLQADEDRATFV